MSWSAKVLAIRDRFKEDENRILICEEIEKILKYAEEYDESAVTVGSQWQTDRGGDSGTLTRSSTVEAGPSTGIASDNGRTGCKVGEDSLQQWLPF